MSTFKLTRNVGTIAETTASAKTMEGLFSIEIPQDGRNLRKGTGTGSQYVKLTEEQKAYNKMVRKAWTNAQMYIDQVKVSFVNAPCVVALCPNDKSMSYIAKSENGPVMQVLETNLNDAVLFYSPDELELFQEQFTDLLDDTVQFAQAVHTVDKKGRVSVKVIKERKNNDTNNDNDIE